MHDKDQLHEVTRDIVRGVAQREYASWNGQPQSTICLDGDFSLAEIEAIADWMRYSDDPIEYEVTR